MKKILLLWFLIGQSHTLLGQATEFTFPVDTLLKNGPLTRRINVCLLPDGYQATEMNKFRTDAEAFMNFMLKTTPFAQYRAYFNVFLIRVPSNQSGATHPGTAPDEATEGAGQPIEQKDTYFGSTFDSFGLHRLVTITQTIRFTNVMATNFPQYDMAVMLVNSPFYGGSGGIPSIATVNGASSNIAVHEVGHTFVSLADEYWAGAQFAVERPNKTQDNNAATVRWRNWLNTPTIGIFPHVPPGQTWFKPTTGTCKMEVLAQEFCNVCRETFVNRFLDIVRPVDSSLPASTSVSVAAPTVFRVNLVRPNPNTLRITWLLNGQPIARQQEEITLSPASLTAGAGQSFTLAAQVVDTTASVRLETHLPAHTQTIQWTLTRSGCALQQTVRAGDWHDPTIWACGSVPTLLHDVVVGHTVSVSTADASARNVTFQNGGTLRYVQNRRLLLAN